jgi:hypothetical protein
MDWAPPSGTYPEARGKKLVPILVVLAVLLLGGGGLAYYFLGSDGGGETEDVGKAAVGGFDPGRPEGAGAETDTAADSDAGAGEEETDGADTGAAADDGKILVTVVTDPEGAVVVVEGMGQVCSKAPCEIQLTQGEPVEVRAELGGKRANMTFTPSEQNRELELLLKGKAPPIRKGGGKGGGNSKTPSGLKIPDLFKDG